MCGTRSGYHCSGCCCCGCYSDNCCSKYCIRIPLHLPLVLAGLGLLRELSSKRARLASLPRNGPALLHEEGLLLDAKDKVHLAVAAGHGHV